MARMNISIPDHIKIRMNSHPEINWSKVAQDGFMEKIEISESIMEEQQKKHDEEVIRKFLNQ